MSARATLAALAALMLAGGLATPVSGAEATAIFASGVGSLLAFDAIPLSSS